jgi:hypothetical protein
MQGSEKCQDAQCTPQISGLAFFADAADHRFKGGLLDIETGTPPPSPLKNEPGITRAHPQPSLRKGSIAVHTHAAAKHIRLREFRAPTPVIACQKKLPDKEGKTLPPLACSDRICNMKCMTMFTFSIRMLP